MRIAPSFGMHPILWFTITQFSEALGTAFYGSTIWAVMKKIIAVVFLIALTWFGGIGACEYSGIRHSAKWFPESVKVSRVLVHQPGCDFFWCAGGSLFEISEQQASQIKSGGLAYLNSLPSVSSHDRPIGKWRMASDMEHDPSPTFGRKSKAQKKRLLFDALAQEDCFVSERAHQEPLLIICPEARLAYSGWFD